MESRPTFRSTVVAQIDQLGAYIKDPFKIPAVLSSALTGSSSARYRFAHVNAYKRERNHFIPFPVNHVKSNDTAGRKIIYCVLLLASKVNSNILNRNETCFH